MRTRGTAAGNVLVEQAVDVDMIQPDTGGPAVVQGKASAEIDAPIEQYPFGCDGNAGGVDHISEQSLKPLRRMVARRITVGIQASESNRNAVGGGLCFSLARPYTEHNRNDQQGVRKFASVRPAVRSRAEVLHVVLHRMIAARGSTARKQLPEPTLLSTSSVPLCASAIHFAIDRPSPLPGGAS